MPLVQEKLINAYITFQTSSPFPTFTPLPVSFCNIFMSFGGKWNKGGTQLMIRDVNVRFDVST